MTQMTRTGEQTQLKLTRLDFISSAAHKLTSLDLECLRKLKNAKAGWPQAGRPLGGDVGRDFCQQEGVIFVSRKPSLGRSF